MIITLSANTAKGCVVWPPHVLFLVKGIYKVIKNNHTLLRLNDPAPEGQL